MTDETDRWYCRAEWRRRRAHQLRLSPLCKMCQEQGVVRPATVVDHVEPHRGDYNKFRLGALQSLCLDHHVGAKHVEELRGYSTAIGIDGMPVDSRHPAWCGRL